jgi:hypothetical protein
VGKAARDAESSAVMAIAPSAGCHRQRFHG